MSLCSKCGNKWFNPYHRGISTCIICGQHKPIVVEIVFNPELPKYQPQPKENKISNRMTIKRAADELVKPVFLDMKDMRDIGISWQKIGVIFKIDMEQKSIKQAYDLCATRMGYEPSKALQRRQPRMGGDSKANNSNRPNKAQKR